MTAQQILAYAKSNPTEIRVVKFLPKDHAAVMSIWHTLTGDSYCSRPDTRWLRIGKGSFSRPYGYDNSPYSSRYPHTDFIPGSTIFTRKPHA